MIVVAKNDALIRPLQEQFVDRIVYKEYLARLAEECGEVASQVNHFELKGVKTLKLGAPDRAAFAKELQDAVRAVVQLAIHYELESELEASVDRSYQEIVIEGIVDPLPEELEGWGGKG